MTFIDGLRQYVSCSKSKHILWLIDKVLVDEEYDTDALEIDIAIYDKESNSNLMNLISPQEVFKTVYNYVWDQKRMFPA